MDEDTASINPTIPPSIEPLGGDEPPVRHRGRVIALVVGVVAVVALIIGGLVRHARSAQASALADCEEQTALAAEAVSGLEKAEKRAKDLTSDQSDETTTALAADLKSVSVPDVPSCSADGDADVLARAAATAKGQAAKAGEQKTILEKDVKKVTDAKDAKTLADAKDSLEAKIKSAEETMKDSKGKVGDGKTLTALDSAVKAARKVLDDAAVTDPTAYEAAGKSLDAPVKAVEDSVAKKTKDAKKKAASKKATGSTGSTGSSSGSTTQRSTGPTGSSTRTYRSTSTSSGSSSARRSTGSTTTHRYTAPKSTYRSTTPRRSSGSTARKSSGSKARKSTGSTTKKKTSASTKKSTGSSKKKTSGGWTAGGDDWMDFTNGVHCWTDGRLTDC